MESSITSLFLALLRAALFEQPVELPIAQDQLRPLMELAHTQGMLAVVFQALQRNTHADFLANADLKAELLKYYGMVYRTQRDNAYINTHVAQFTAFMARHHLPCYVMKGAVNALNYPDPSLRATGDIDFYCPPDTYEQTRRLLAKKLGLPIDNYRSTKHDSFEYKGVHYELHAAMTDLIGPRHRRAWRAAVKADLQQQHTVNINGQLVSILSPTLNAAYLFVHFFIHLVTSGISIRQMCDWALWHHRYADVIDADALARCLRRIGLYRAYTTLGRVLVDHLGLLEEDFLLPIPATAYAHRMAKRCLYDVLRSGNKGYAQDELPEGILHSLQTGWYTLRQTLRYLSLAPVEVGWRVPDMAYWSVASYFVKGKRYTG